MTDARTLDAADTRPFHATRLLVPLDGTDASAAALPVAKALGARLGVEVDVLDCFPPGFPVDAELRWVREQGDRVGLPVGDDAVHPTLEVVSEITAAAAAQPGTVVCMASHGRTALGELVYGSVTHDVIVASAMPVVVVGPQALVPRSFDRLQVCVDGSPASHVALGAAATWAADLGAVPWLTQVVEPVDLDDDDGVAAGDVVEGSLLGRLARDARFGRAEVEWDVLHGHDVAASLARWGSEQGPALAVIGSHGRGGLERLRLGSVTSRLVHLATCPVLVLGPRAAG